MTTPPNPAFDLPLPRRIWWPWTDGVEQVTFTCRFTVRQPTQVLLALSTGGQFRAWLDGAPLVFAEQFLPPWRQMCRSTLALEPGEHLLWIAADARPNPQPFVLASLDWQESSQPRRVTSGSSWRMARGWHEPGEGASLTGPDWRPAWTFDGVWAEPWGMPCDAPDDYCRLSTGWQMLEREPLAQVLEQDGGLNGAAVLLAADGSLRVTPVQPCAAQPPRVALERPSNMWHISREVHSQQANTWLQTYEGRAPFVVFDAGAETFARVRLTLRSGGPAVLALTSGESLPETHSYIRRVTDVFRLEDGESFTTTPVGLRYVKLTVLGGEGELALEPLELQHVRYPLQSAGSFHCSDPLLDEVWTLSARTVELCLQNEIWDGIKRDQLPWMGDLAVEALAVYACFGDTRLARRTLAVLGDLGPAPAKPLEQQRYPGLQAVWKTVPAPGAPGGDINGIPTYTMWWIVGLHDYWQYSGDEDLLRELSGELRAALDHIIHHVGADGIWMDRESRLYVDWSPISIPARFAFCHLLATYALRLGADLLEAAGQHAAALHYRVGGLQMAERTCEVWCEGGPTRLAVDSGHHVPAMAIRSGVLAQEDAQILFERTLQPDLPLRMTYWHRYGDLEAAALVGKIDWGLAYLRKYWGPALGAGVTSLWEAFEESWLSGGGTPGGDPHGVSIIGDAHGSYGGYRTSLCHGWSAGGAVWLQRAVLGVQPGAPGYSALRFTPNLGDLQWAEGSAPTPQGPVMVRLERRAGQKSLARLRLPEGMRLVLGEGVADDWEIVEEGDGLA